MAHTQAPNPSPTSPFPLSPLQTLPDLLPSAPAPSGGLEDQYWAYLDAGFDVVRVIMRRERPAAIPELPQPPKLVGDGTLERLYYRCQLMCTVLWNATAVLPRSAGDGGKTGEVGKVDGDAADDDYFTAEDTEESGCGNGNGPVGC